ncbi:bifunctional glycosyltransferase family 2/GtrA family protein [Yinghuangia soli]|uniref:dolichyl-phosphate beta-glucosyltransferase n=1 Tax=Yinghuangia soli TaxID=2908204 RepID=A0AA41U073_9ACTN|nr:bifunctional glycosyltransferase family 2/GtrA family protein [Yinghuangia soli]MCF2526142.1 bifunctional glycosyltransferase family 2/GtrA family protein [Yinghuangia soli]
MTHSTALDTSADAPEPPSTPPSSPRPGVPAHPNGRRQRLVDVVVPVYNEQHVLEQSVRRLHGYLIAEFPYAFRITVADNASTDGTWHVASYLADELPHVRAVHLDLKGRGRALRKVWAASDADVVAYMDVDLSTDLDAFLPLVAPLLSGHSDVAIGSRLSRGSAVVRGPKREFVSRSYNLLLRATLAARFSDAQCGFKAARTEVAQALLPHVEDEAWFFDTELLLLAQRSGLRIHEVPVDWVDDPDSRVDVLRTAVDDLRGMARVARRITAGTFRAPMSERTRDARLPTGMRRQIPRFALVGVLSTLAFVGLYALLRTAMPALLANALALLVTAVGNTAANRRFTFGVRGRSGALRHQAQGGLAFVLGLAVTSLALGALHVAAPGASRAVELTALVAANALATLVRFLLLRVWVFRGTRSASDADADAATDQGSDSASPAPGSDSPVPDTTSEATR